ncbi:MAG: type II toxin-antitoxin system HicA family toxin [Methanosarcina mazei]|uniref:type II toxin-antitoxin system HicA family toxin n=1 Tax=Methanosarcina soligelidi TaxID=1036677 RepID=UPI001F4860AD|nr:type II toxin-antitoxin system HicA family toxin [Methanosarcina soligelidi]
MPKLPTPSAREVIRALSGQGFQVVSQRGRHIKMKKVDLTETRIVIIPDHSEIPAGTLKSIIRQAFDKQE